MASDARVSRISAFAVPLVSIALIVGVLLLPDLGPKPTGPEPVAAYHARIVELLGSHRPNPNDPGAGFLPDARVLMLEGPNAGKQVDAYLEGPGGQQNATGYRAGEDVVVTETRDPTGTPFVAVSDRWRLPQLAILAAVFALAVVLVGGSRGARALLALILTAAVVIRVLVPLLLQGVPPIPVAVVIATGLTIVTIGLTEGFTRPSVAAILGTTAALGLTALLAGVATVAAGFTNAAGTDLAFVQTTTGEALDLRGLLLAAFMLGAVGVLDDVTVTQAAAVDELRGHAGLQGSALYASAFNVGRSHIAATVNTLFLAYVGASLPLLVLFALSRQPVSLTLNSEAVSVEIVRTLVGSLGIVAAVPLTTAIAAWLSSQPLGSSQALRVQPGVSRILRRPLVALVLGLAVLGVVMAGATLGLAALMPFGPGTPLTPTVLGPSFSPAPTREPSNASETPSQEPLPTETDPGPTPTLVAVFDVGQSATVTEAGGTATVAVVEVRLPADPSGPQLVQVRIRYETSTGFDVRPSAWVGLTGDGDDVTASTTTAQSPSLSAGRLNSGQTQEGWLDYQVAARGDSLFLDYRLPDGSTLFSFVLY